MRRSQVARGDGTECLVRYVTEKVENQLPSLDSVADAVVIIVIRLAAQQSAQSDVLLVPDPRLDEVVRSVSNLFTNAYSTPNA